MLKIISSKKVVKDIVTFVYDRKTYDSDSNELWNDREAKGWFLTDISHAFKSHEHKCVVVQHFFEKDID